MKTWVDLVSFDAIKREGTVVARCILESGTVRIERAEGPLRGWLENGVYSPPHRRKLTVVDGRAFLEALGYEFKSAYLFATDVREAEDFEEYVVPPMRPVRRLSR